MSHLLTCRYLAVVFCAILLSACDDQPASSSSSQLAARDRSAAAEKANEQSRQWQQHFEAEHALRVQAESKLSHQEAARTWWQTTATLLAVAAVVLLFAGTTLGSAARHESQKP